MKINVTVDLSEFYSEEDEMTFSDQIKSHIVFQVKQSIFTDFRDKIGDEFKTAIVAAIKEEKEAIITAEINALIDSKKLKKGYNGDEVSISEWISYEFERNGVSGKEINEKLEKIVKSSAESLGKEIKERYDFLFASQIVSKLSENGLLNEQAKKLFLDK